jgi:mannose-6-phosphate isomerase class I
MISEKTLQAELVAAQEALKTFHVQQEIRRKEERQTQLKQLELENEKKLLDEMLAPLRALRIKEVSGEKLTNNETEVIRWLESQ